MGVPKYRTSKSKKNMRRSHHHLSANPYTVCEVCDKPRLSHVVCPSCDRPSFLMKEIKQDLQAY